MDRAERFITGELLSDFKRRKLAASDLESGYEGPKIEAMKLKAGDAGIDGVDFDVALKELEKSEHIKTGPWDITEPIVSQYSIVMPFPYSKCEYAYLTQSGYKEASTSKTMPARSTQTIIHGDQYNVGQAAAVGPHSNGTVNVQQEWTAIQNEIDLNALTSELEQLKKHLQQSALSSSDFQRLALLSEAEEHAKKRDGSKAMEVLSKVGKGALDVAKDIGTEIAAKVIAKSMGLEP